MIGPIAVAAENTGALRSVVCVPHIARSTYHAACQTCENTSTCGGKHPEADPSEAALALGFSLSRVCLIDVGIMHRACLHRKQRIADAGHVGCKSAS